MNTFPLKIVTADGLKYDGQAEELIVRTTSGDLGILAGHTNCVAPLGMGRATIVVDGKSRHGACATCFLRANTGQFVRWDHNVAKVTRGCVTNDNGVASLDAFGKRAGASDFNVIGMRSDCKNSHGKSSFVLFTVRQGTSGAFPFIVLHFS